MNTLSNLLHILLPLLGIILLLAGIMAVRINFIIAALWIGLTALLLDYQSAGGEILGTFFGYKNAAIYTVNFLVLLISFIYLFFRHPFLQKNAIRYITGFVSACLVVGGIILLINLWMNACFIENRRPGTPVMQVATFLPVNYCTYRYVFYKVGSDGSINYLCPNYYGIVPSIGHLEVSPAFLLNYLTKQLNVEIKVDGKGN